MYLLHVHQVGRVGVKGKLEAGQGIGVFALAGAGFGYEQAWSC